MPHWLHLLELVTIGVVLLFLAVLLSAFGWGVLIIAAICGVAVWLLGRRLAHRMSHRYPTP